MGRNREGSVQWLTERLQYMILLAHDFKSFNNPYHGHFVDASPFLGAGMGRMFARMFDDNW